MKTNFNRLERTTTTHPRARTATKRSPMAIVATALAALLVLALGASIAQAGGGVGVGGGGHASPSGSCSNQRLGSRTLSRGDCGTDVQTVNWILRAMNVRNLDTTQKKFKSPTYSGVRDFQNSVRGLRSNGVVNKSTRKAMASHLVGQKATWYGPGLYGNGTACGKVKLTKKTIGVAHRTLPCGSKVVIGYRGKWARATVIDRGPYSSAKWDLTKHLSDKLGFTKTGAGIIRVGKVTGKR